MLPHDAYTDDEIERLLRASTPTTTAITPAIEEELARMSVRSRTDYVPLRSGKRLSQEVATIGVVSLLLVGGASAAAATQGWWSSSWWADEPDAVVHYTLPSGAQCEHRIGGMMVGTDSARLRDFAREWYRTADLEGIIAAGVDEQVLAQRTDRDRWFVADDGSEVPAWYGTEQYQSPDSEYLNAVQQSITIAFEEALQNSGLDLTTAPDARGLSIAGEISCPGAQW